MKDRNTFEKVIIFLCMALVVCIGCLSFAYGETGVVINEINFPDEVFREFVRQYDNNNSGVLSEDDIAYVYSMNISYSDVENIRGIECFTSLMELECINNYSLYELDVSGCSALEVLRCDENSNLARLDVAGCEALKELHCMNNNNLTELTANGCWSLVLLNCIQNQLSELNVSGCSALENLYCENNQLSKVEVSSCKALERLSCGYNLLSKLDISGCTLLKELNCYDNVLKELDVSSCKALNSLRCESNQLSKLDVSNCKELERLFCENNLLSKLDISGCTLLKELNCYNNILTELDVSGCKALNRLWCESNQLSKLDVSGCTSLWSLSCHNNILTELDASGCEVLGKIDSDNNKLKRLTVDGCKELATLNCAYNELPELDIKECRLLYELDCSNNKLTKLDASHCTKMGYLDCTENELTQLYISNTQLEHLNCSRNNLTELDVSRCPKLDELTWKCTPVEENGMKRWSYSIMKDKWTSYGLDMCVDPSVTVHASSQSKVNAFVARCYKIILKRLPDESGQKTWYNELSSGRKTASEIIDRFVKSSEFTEKNYSYETIIDILYEAMLGRKADQAGEANWISKLANGQPIAAVVNGFCISSEFGEICASYGINPGYVIVPGQFTLADEKIQLFIRRCYRIILNRDPDEVGMNTWFNELKSRRKAASEIIDQFVNSPEFKGKEYTKGDSVEILYKAMLGRGSDAAGKANWVSKLLNGHSFAAVINGFCISPEFKAICASYGIEPGTIKIQALSGMAEEEALSMLAYKAKAPITKKSETNPTRVEIINPSDTIDLNIGTAVQAVYINEEKAKEFISRCYQCILGREASDSELNNWIGQMTNGTKMPDQIARGFLFSNEFKGKKVSNEDLVKILYKVYMNRDADLEGLKTWTEKLNNGTSLDDLLNTFSKTGEFKKVVSEMSK